MEKNYFSFIGITLVYLDYLKFFIKLRDFYFLHIRFHKTFLYKCSYSIGAMWRGRSIGRKLDRPRQVPDDSDDRPQSGGFDV